MMSLRSKRRGLHATLTACAVTVGVLAGTSQVASAFVACPSSGTRSANVDSWNTLWPTGGANAKGVTLCEGVGGLFNNTRGYLQIADLGDLAKVRLHAEAEWATSPEPLLSQPDTLYRKRTAPDWYSWLRSIDTTELNSPYRSYLYPRTSQLFSVTNASFFADTSNENETTLSFPLVVRGGSNTFGQAQREYEISERDYDWEQPKKALLLSDIYESVLPEHARVQLARVNPIRTRYTSEDLYNELLHVGGIPTYYDTVDAAVSFTPEVRVGESELRTYVGVYGDTVYVWVTDDEFTNAEAAATMQEIQPGMEVIQMDGGGSSQFYSDYGEMDSSIPIFDREVPVVLAIYRAR